MTKQHNVMENGNETGAATYRGALRPRKFPQFRFHFCFNLLTCAREPFLGNSWDARVGLRLGSCGVARISLLLLLRLGSSLDADAPGELPEASLATLKQCWNNSRADPRGECDEKYVRPMPWRL